MLTEFPTSSRFSLLSPSIVLPVAFPDSLTFRGWWHNQGVSENIDMKIPAEILPKDGRFGCGPTLIRPEQLHRLADSKLMGTSHRQAPVKDLVARCITQMRELFNVPADYTIALGNGGATTFWATATASLIRERAAHGVFGEFGAKFAKETTQAPFLKDSLLTRVEPGEVTLPQVTDEVDVYAWPHQETSTGAVAPVTRIGQDGQLVLIDATSIAGAVEVDLTQADAYYFSLQKALGSDGGLWFAFLSPAAVSRAAEITGNPQESRWIPSILNLITAVNNSLKFQTLNTPALATLELLGFQLEWLSELGGLGAAAKRVSQSSGAIYDWAEAKPYAAPFVKDPAHRSPVVSTVEFDDSIDTKAVIQVLRQNGIVDVSPYRSVGRNQLRIGTFPSTDPADTAALLASLDYVIAHL